MISLNQVNIEGYVNSLGSIVYRATDRFTRIAVKKIAPPSVHTGEAFPANRAKLLATLEEELKRRGRGRAS